MSKPFYQKLNLSKEQFTAQLQYHFDKDQSIPSISKIFNTTSATIFNWSNRLGIKRARSSTLRNKEWLTQKYSVEKLNMAEIASLVDVTYQAVDWWLTAHHISRRPNTEIQQMANVKRPRSSFHDLTSFTSRGYCGWYKDIFYYRSINEVVWYMMNEGQFETIKSEPFVIENYKPDFLIDNKIVVEIKGTPTAEISKLYAKRSAPIIAAGYEYKIIYVQHQFPQEYLKIRNYLRNHGAAPGVGYQIDTNLLR